MSVPTEQVLRLLRAVRSGHMTKAEADQAFLVLDDGRPVSSDSDPDGTALLAAALEEERPRVSFALPPAEVYAQRYALIEAMTVEEFENTRCGRYEGER